MGIVIKGLNHLDANNYNRIMIREENGNYLINIKNNKGKYDGLKTSYRISDILDEQTNEEIIMTIIESFLRNSKINKIKDNEFLDRYNGKFTVVKGTRELDLQVFNPKLSIISKIIINKYLNDRLEFCDKGNINSYEIEPTYNKTSYKEINTVFGKVKRLELLQRNGKTAAFEQSFLKEFISEKLCNQNEIAKIVHRGICTPVNCHYVPTETCLTCGNFHIKLLNPNMDLLNEVTEVVNTYNKEREESKKMQLKLEGF